MSRRPRPRRPQRARGAPSNGAWAAGAVILVALVVGVVALAQRSASTLPSGAMGQPLDVEPNVVAGATRIGGVEVDATEVDFGHVPLNREVTQTFRLRNTTAAPVSLGSAAIETLEGC